MWFRERTTSVTLTAIEPELFQGVELPTDPVDLCRVALHDREPDRIAVLDQGRLIEAMYDLEPALSESDYAGAFTSKNLARYRTVVFLNTTGDVLDAAQQDDFERYIQAGGGYVGVHAASDTEYDWPWYGRLVGAWFIGNR